MKYLYEESDLNKNPFECFYMSSEDEHFPVSPHWHFYMEMILVLEGEALVRASEEERIVKKGDIFIFHPRTVHAIYNKTDQKLFYAVIKVDLNMMTVSSNYSPKIRSIYKCAEKKKMFIQIPSDDVNSMGLERIFHRCIYEMNSKKYGYDMIVRSRLYELMIMIIRFWQDRGFIIDSEAFVEDNSYDIYNITQYIESNMGRDLKVTDVADSCGMSYSYFARKFQKIYGMSCKEYIEDMRIYKAEEMLIFTDFDLTEISQVTGFSDCSHMIKSFKQKRGVTPKQFRLSHAYDPKKIKPMSWSESFTNLS